MRSLPITAAGTFSFFAHFDEFQETDLCLEGAAGNGDLGSTMFDWQTLLIAFLPGPRMQAHD